MSDKVCSSVGVVGAGIQGVCTGLQLLKKNIPTTIFDQNDPGSMASYGNAGHFSPYAVIQLNRPDILYDIPKMLLSSYGPLALKWNYIPKMLPWIFKYLKNCNTKSMLHTAKSMNQILSLSMDAYEEIFQEIDTTNLIEQKGIIYVWTNKNLKSRELEIKVRDDLGVKQKILNVKEILDLEPNLKPVFSGGCFYDYAYHAKDPHGILKKIFELFLKKGGKFIKKNVNSVHQSQANQTIIKTDDGEYKFEKSVIACGAYSKKLTDQLGEKIPLDTERGYNVTLPNSDFDLKTHLTFAEHGFVVSTINKAIRVGGAVEFAGLKRPPNFNRASALLKKAENFMPGLLNGNGYDKWMGFRPSLPDSLPVIDYSTLSKRVLYAFGHGHLGLTQAAGTAELVRDLIIGQNPAINMSAFSAKRF